MSYCNEQDMIDRFDERELIQLTGGCSSINGDVLGRAMADAAAEIDGYLGSRHSLPLSPVPPVLTRVACDLARYRLYDDQVTETVTQRYKDSIRFLQSVSKGEVSLGVADPEPAAASTVSVTGPERRYTTGRMRRLL